MPRSFATVDYLQGTSAGGATANGNGATVDVLGQGTQLIEIRETAGGTATVTLQGSFDGTNWYSVGYQQVDATLAPARAVAALSVTANSAHVYQVLDFYPLVRAAVSAVAGGATLSVKVYGASI